MKKLLVCMILTAFTITHIFAQDASANFDVQAAIEDASSGDTIVIPAGTYTDPITIDKELTLDGRDAVLEIKSNRPAIQIDTSKAVVLRNLQILQRAETKPQQGDRPYAVYIYEGDVLIEDCTFKGTGSSAASPCAVLATEQSILNIKNSRFDGFNFTIQFGNESSGSVEGCLIMNPGHCGITVAGSSEVSLTRNIVTGSRYHGIRCTGGEIIADSNLVIANRNRGFYLGNKSAFGTLSNNLIIDNATGINVFANSKLSIINNVIIGSSYAGLAIIDTATVDFENNVITQNERGVIGFSAVKGETPSIKLRGENIAFDNATQSEGIKLPSELIGVDPQFKDSGSGLFAAEENKAHGMGLTNPEAMQSLWKKREKTQ